MEGRIGRLHCRYRIATDSVLPLISRLNEVGREALALSCGRSLDRIMEDDGAVWVVRSVSVPLTMNGKASWDDAALARQWADRIAVAAKREVAKGADGNSVVRFEDQADFVATFVSDLLRGQAWSLWYYGCFERFRNQSTGAAALAVLLENRDHLAQILARISSSGSLESLLRVVGPDAARQIWSDELKGPAPDLEELYRPIFTTALQLASQYGATERVDSPTADRWLREYLQTGPIAADWRDASGLSIAVMGALDFLRRRGYLPVGFAPPPQSHEPAWRQPSDEFDWLDWNLIEEFFAAVASSPSPEDQELRKGEASLPPASSTRRAKRLMADLSEVVVRELPFLAARREDSANTAIRIYSWLVSQHPEWSGDPFAIRTVEGLLAVGEWITKILLTWMEPALAALQARAEEAGISKSHLQEWLKTQRGSLQLTTNMESQFAALSAGDRADLERLRVLQSLLSGPCGRDRIVRYSQLHTQRVEALSASNLSEQHSRTTFSALVLKQLSAAPAGDPIAPSAREFLRTFGDEAVELAAAMAAAEVPKSVEAADLATGIAIRCAGIFLLLRAMADIRLASVARKAEYPVAPCVMVLGMCWAGREGVFQGRLDTGIGLLAGQGADMTVDELRRIWQGVPAENHLRFQIELLKMLVARGIVRSSSVEIHTVALGGDRHAIVFGCGQLWPMVRIIDGDQAAGTVIHEMTESWSKITGVDPQPEAASEDSGAALRQALDDLGMDNLGLPLADWTLVLGANSLLRCWAIWLRQFSASSASYLLRNFIRRSGSIVMTDDGMLVEMDARPLDIVLEMAGYFDRISARTEPWECKFSFRTPRQ
jgi:hypothetical protein